jgi:DNA-binding LacI/PurR family transcriptional regulator
VEFDHHQGVDSVYSNEHRSAVMVLEHLKQHGHEHIAWLGILDKHANFQTIGELADNPTVADLQSVTVHGARHAAWANLSYCQWGGPSYPLILVERDWQKKSLNEAVNEGVDRLLAEHKQLTAIICSCDPVAMALYSNLQERGLRVPEDISVISYGGQEWAKTANPTVTCVEMPMETLGKLIPELVERKLADPEAAPVSIQVEATLWEGQSVATIKA